MFSDNKELQTIQRKCLGIFRVFQEVCEENHLRYFVSGGTLLGCVRHQGFIPWDDDMDIAMPREDYEKLILLANCLPEHYQLSHFKHCKEDEKPQSHHVQIVDTQTTLLKNNTIESKKISVWVDIYPLDGLPPNIIRRNLHIFHARFWWLIMQLIWFKENVDVKKERGFLEKKVFSILMHLPASSNKKLLSVLSHFDNVAKKYSFFSSDRLFSFHGIYASKELLYRKWFEKDTELVFENILCKAPLAYDEILKHYYGQYEKEIKNNSKHVYTVVKL